MKNINCYICKTKMDYIKNSELTTLGGECEEYKCSKCGEVIYRPIKNQERKSVIMDRKSILERIKVGSQWTFADNKENYQVIIENMNFLYDILNLGDIINDLINIEFENKKQGITEPKKEITGWLTARQVKCIELISDNISKRNVQGAFHELYDFIESYKRLYDKPIDMVERIIISSSITQIRRTIEEESKNDKSEQRKREISFDNILIELTNAEKELLHSTDIIEKKCAEYWGMLMLANKLEVLEWVTIISMFGDFTSKAMQLNKKESKNE